MGYYHVLLCFRDTPSKTRCILSDLSEKELRKRFLRPYRNGRQFLSGNEVVETSHINKVTIIHTQDISTNELKKLKDSSWKATQEINRNSNSVFVVNLSGYHLEDIVEAGQDVTSAYISGPPGDGSRRGLRVLLMNPWIQAIGTGLIVAGMVWWFGWN